MDNDHNPETQIGFKKHSKLPSLDPNNINNLSYIQATMSPLRKKKKIKKGYEIAEYSKSLQHLKTQTYNRKVTYNGNQQFEPHDVMDENSDLKISGLGVYLYLEFIKRLLITFVIMSAISTLSIVFTYQGDGLSAYKDSYTLTLAKFSIGNLNNADKTTYLVVIISDVLNCIVFFCFYMHYRYFHYSVVQEQERDHQIVNPVTYALSISGFEQADHLQENMKQYFDKNFKGAYEVEIIYDYKGNFSHFIEYDEIIEKVQKQHQIINQTQKSTDQLVQFQKDQLKIQSQILTISKDFEPLYAIVHFHNLRGKFDFINHCKKFALQNKFGSKFKRCICCIPPIPQKLLFMKQQLLINSNNLSRPQQINWQNLDLTFFSRLIRIIFSLIFIIITVFITSSIIGLCTLYVASLSNCSNYDSTSTTLANAVAAGGQNLYCYCSQLYTLYGSNSADLQAACKNLSETILVTNIIQITASVVSAITNALLLVIIQLIASYLLRPQTKPSQYSFIFIAVLISNYINSTLMPLFLNGDVFGFRPVSYLGFIDFINTTTIVIFKDFDKDWYAIVSPYYLNFFIIVMILPFISLVVFFLKYKFIHWRVRRMCENNEDKQNHPVIQKQANSTITWVILDLPYQQASLILYLLMCMMYSSLIPLLIPIFMLALFFNYLCKKAILMKFSLRIPANENLSLKSLNILPFILLFKIMFGIWSYTSPGIFSVDSHVFNFSLSIISGQFSRIFDVLILTATFAGVLAWIIFDYTLISIFGFLRQCCCKDELQLPVTFAAIQNKSYNQRIRKVNILGSYKVANNPTYGHAILAYKQLLYKNKHKNLKEDSSLEIAP